MEEDIGKKLLEEAQRQLAEHIQRERFHFPRADAQIRKELERRISEKDGIENLRCEYDAILSKMLKALKD